MRPIALLSVLFALVTGCCPRVVHDGPAQVGACDLGGGLVGLYTEDECLATVPYTPRVWAALLGATTLVAPHPPIVSPRAAQGPSRASLLEGWTVKVRRPDATDAEGTWLEPGLGRIWGLADCRGRVLTVTWARWPVSTLAHEMVHALQGCDAGAPEDASMDVHVRGHWNWRATGIRTVLDRLESPAWATDPDLAPGPDDGVPPFPTLGVPWISLD